MHHLPWYETVTNEICTQVSVQPIGLSVRTNWPSCMVYTFTVPSYFIKMYTDKIIIEEASS